MQDNTIISFANVVESRDGNTGGHIRRTAAYVKVIADALSKNPKYAATLTPEYRQRLVKSAPLHDIGKISIPDAVLNKNGKLTDAEFGIIKTHPAVGLKMLREIMSGIDGDNYLSDAIDMAFCHHEKWDGSGYPNGLAGDEIPLSARIMAVADVFDALVSKRSYKEPFTLDKAEDIIIEGSGTHFDPDVVEAFKSVTDKIEAIAKS
ncbi:MAG: HD domain-containing phosphohydrolase [Synergistaceae bacterium]|nr:HD domain-containing phosphohydrolase [Synergistaceae bacterium]